MKNTLTRIAISIPENAIPVFEDALEPFVQSILWSVDDEADIQVMEGFSDIPPDEGLLSAAIKSAAKKTFDILLKESFFGAVLSTLSAKRAAFIFTFKWSPIITSNGTSSSIKALSVKRRKLKSP